MNKINTNSNSSMGRNQSTQKILTEPGVAFWREHGLILDFAEFFSAMTSLGIMHHSLTKKDGYQLFTQQPQEENSLLLYIKNFLVSWDIESSTLYPKSLHNNLLLESSFSRAVDNFLTYLKELLKTAFLNRPEMLKSEDEERLDFILQYSTMEELISAIAEKKVEQLSLKGSYAIQKYFEKFGITLLKDKKAKEDLHLYISIRNIIVHNRGMVNEEFKKRVPYFTSTVNEHVKITHDLFRSFRIRLGEFASEIDVRAAKHWKINTKEYTVFIPTNTLRVSGEFTELNIKEYYTDSIYHRIQIEKQNK